MRAILNYLLGEEMVSKQSDKDIREALIGTAMCVVFGAMCLFAIYVCG
jgi:hypothetical protein